MYINDKNGGPFVICVHLFDQVWLVNVESLFAL